MFLRRRKNVIITEMLYIGPHVSISKDISLAPERAYGNGAGAFAIFTKNQKVWSAKPLANANALEFSRKLERFGFSADNVLAHAGYLINPATPDPALREKSIALAKDEIARCILLGLDKINMHPGAFIEGERKDGLARAASFFDCILEDNDFQISIENTSGSGTNLGGELEEIAALIGLCRHDGRLGVTLDTAHLYGYGYDVSVDPVGILDEAVSLFGAKRILGMHLNDSKAPLASRKDRHESIGKGYIGLKAFLEITSHPAAQDKPLILETPDQMLWPNEIRSLTSARS